MLPPVCKECGERCGIKPNHYIPWIKEYKKGTRHQAKQMILETSQDKESGICIEVFV